MRHARSASFDASREAPWREAVRWRWTAAIIAGLGLIGACGGRAQDTEEGDIATEAVAGLGPTGGRAMPRPAGASGSTGSPGRQAPRAGEICYSPERIAETSGLNAILPFLPEDAFDGNGCLASDYSAWLDGGGCNYDPRAAVVRGERCCHLLDASMPGCG